MSRVGIFGGTFDPVHLGHLITAQYVRELRDLDKIIFVPSYIAPHKKDIKASSPEHRINMLKLSIESVSYFDWTDYEIKKQGVSYSIDTLKEMKKHYDEIEMIVGEDNIMTFDKWKSPEEIFNIATIIVLRRKLDENIQYDNPYIRRAIFVDTPRIDINGTEIRERIRKGLPVNFLVPQKVLKYINEINLYKV